MRGKWKSLFGKKGLSTVTGNGDDALAIQQMFTNEIVSSLGTEAPINVRIEALKDLCSEVETKVLEQHAVEMLFKTISDMFSMTDNEEARHVAFQFLVSLTKGQYERLKLFRSSLFHLIVCHNIPDDLFLRIELLKVLTDNGKNVSYCEQIGNFLITFMSDALYANNSDVFFNILINIIHYNSSFLDKDITTTIVQKTCGFCNSASSEHDIENCLLLLDATVRYSGFSSNALLPIIETLCRTVNIEKFCQHSWKLMRNLVGTKLGHTAISKLCRILEDNNNILEIALLRGAVFFIGMSIWGSKRVPSLHFTPIHVLPSFKICLQANNYNVGYEISLSIQRVVKKFGADQEYMTWDLILDIIESLQHLAEGHTKESERELLQNIIHSILCNIEQLYLDNLFKGAPEKFFKLLASFSKTKPDKYMGTLLNYLCEQIYPDNDEWEMMLDEMMTEYLKPNMPLFVQVKLLNMVASIFRKFKYSHENDLLTLILKIDPCIERNLQVRKELMQLYSDIMSYCHPINLPKVLSTVQLYLDSIDQLQEHSATGLQDYEILIDSMIKAFQEKLLNPDSIYVSQIFSLLVSHVNKHYMSNIASFTGGTLRKNIFSLILRLRANSNRYIGLYTESKGTKFSIHTMLCSSEPAPNLGNKLQISMLDFHSAFEVLLKCLKNELDWCVLEFVLKNIEHILHNKPIFVSSRCNMNKLTSALCNLINDPNSLKKVKNCPNPINQSTFRNTIFPCLAVLASYHAYISRERQVEFVRCLEFGLNTFSAKTCVTCLTVCALEMQKVMVRLLPSILVKLSQISATVSMSTPILDFLSVLTEIPNLYANFVEEQYMCIFAMALPYTDSYKYTQFTVMLAHKIIVDWFTRCRLLFRKGFVSLIANALKCGPYRDSDNNVEKDNDKKVFHEEMTDICLDMMSHWAFSSQSIRWKRSSLEDFLFQNGTSQTWYVGNMLITITTSGHSRECEICNAEKIQKPVNQITIDKKPGNHATIEKTTSTKSQKFFQTELKDLSKDLTHATLEKKESANKILDSETDLVNVSDPTDVNKCMLEDVKVVSAAIATLDHVVDEEGVEATPLVAKLTSELSDSEIVKTMPAFSPSEQLLFSRQGSKAVVKDNFEEESEESLSDEEFSDDEIEEVPQVDPLPEDFLKKPLSSKLSTDSKSSKLFEVTEKVNTGNAPKMSACQCECGGWAEILIRRPTSTMSWIMKCTQDSNDQFLHLEELSTSAFRLEDDYSPPKFENLFEKMLIFDGSPSLFDQHEENLKKPDELSDSRSRRSASDTSSVSSFSMVKSEKVGSRRHSTGSINSNTILQYDFGLTTNKKTDYGLTTNKTSENQKLGHIDLSHDHTSNYDGQSNLPKMYSNSKDFISPSLIFVQLFYTPAGYKLEHPAVLLDCNEKIERAINILDRLHCFNAHKFGVLYVNRGQESDEQKILQNEFGSPRYTNFISGLGELVRLSDCEMNGVYLGGLNEGGTDGKFACVWRDATTNVVFHVATLMSLKENDVQCTSKKRHIGNDAITIIYDDSKRGYEYGTIKGQFNFAEIVIRPLEYNSNRVVLRRKGDLGVEIVESYVVSDISLPILVRKIAIHTNICVLSETKQMMARSFTFNWLERLKMIKSIISKNTNESQANRYDFTFFT